MISQDDNIIDKPTQNDFGEPWYNANCDILSKMAGVIPYGTVSSSGFGDGSYYCYYIEDNSEIVAIKIVFINPQNTQE